MARKTKNMKQFATAEELGVVPGVTAPADCTNSVPVIVSAEDELVKMIDEPAARHALAKRWSRSGDSRSIRDRAENR